MKYIQLIPCLKPFGESSRKFDLTPRLYGEFLIRLFDLWYKQYKKGNYISIRLFDNIISMLSGHPPEQCGLSGQCVPQFVVEANGEVYPCDFYVVDKYRCGNINEDSIREIELSEGIKRFLLDIQPQNALCVGCGFYKICGGGCKRYRSFYNRQAGYCPMRSIFKKIAGDFKFNG